MKSAFDYIRKYKFLLLIITPAFFLYMLVIFPSGTFFCFKDTCGINFWGVHGHDAIWHLAIANVSFNKFPFIAPTFAGENLYGYNYLLDLFIFFLTKVGIPAIFSYFKLLPVLWFVFYTLFLVVLGKKLRDSPLFLGLFLFLNYFAGSFSYLLTLYHHKTINGSSTLLPQPAMHMMSNLPYAYSLLPFLAILILMTEKKLDFKKIVLLGVCLFIIMGLKFYGGLISIFLIISYLFLKMFLIDIEKLFIYLFFICLFIFGAVLLFYDPFRSIKTGSIFGFAPFALVHTITETPDQFYLQNMTDARYYIMAQGKIGPRLVWIEFINLTLFLFFYLGTRFFAFLYIYISALKRKLDAFDLSTILTTFFSILLTVTLVQKAEWWNTIQFFFYAIFLLTIYLAKFVYDLWQKRNVVFTLITLMIVLLSIPTSIDLVRLFWAIPGATYLPIEEMKALDFLKKQPDGIVLTPLYDKKWKSYDKSNQLYAYEDTAYISAFSAKKTYLADILQLRLTGVPYEKRLEKIKNMDCSILKEVDYVYEIRGLLDKEKIMISCKPKNAKKIYDSGSIFIYSIIK